MKDTGGGLIVIFGGRSEIGLELATRLAAGATAAETTLETSVKPGVSQTPPP